MKKRVNFYFNREYKRKVLLSLFNGFKHTEQNNYILEMDGWYSIYNLLRMRKLFNLPFNKSIKNVRKVFIWTEIIIYVLP